MSGTQRGGPDGSEVLATSGGYSRFGLNDTYQADGGSGIVLVRYEGDPKTVGGTILSEEGYIIHTFTETNQPLLFIIR